jgi:hypothetical protein
MSTQEFLEVLANAMRGLSDDKTVSIGTWDGFRLIHPDLPAFEAKVQITVGELRNLAKHGDTEARS